MRFSGFEGEWEDNTLGEICKMQAGKFVSASEIYNEWQQGLFHCYGGNGLRGYTKSNNQNGMYSLIGRQGALCGNVTLVDGKFYATEHAVVVTPKSSTDNLMLHHLLKHLNLNQYATGAAQPGLSVQNLEKVEVKMPKAKAEQQKIASFLSLIDERIKTQNKIIEGLKVQMLGLQEEIFRQRIKIKDEQGNRFSNWEEKNLGEIGETFNGLSGKTKDDFGKGKLYIQYKQIFDSARIRLTDCGQVEILEGEKQNKVKYGDIFFTTSSETPNEIGMSSVLLDDVHEAYLNSFCFGYRAFSLDELNPIFASYFFRSTLFRNQVTNLAQGSTRYNMSKVELMKLKVLLPSLEEQIIISNILSASDKRIEVENHVLERYKLQKQYLLKNLFI
ncbi:MAG: hypothetical protein CMP76_03840 [Flavobacterium sp.]|uniref:restriction endonuclease subunit S n=1 Tax=Flavobacterium sp. TaxID=239 RepID=UPI000C489BF0|nr:restriction endonuclease subunit S [Flavobacterium sp.]MBF02408.1 hypothetical protein [Flavobacterium sp.]